MSCHISRYLSTPLTHTQEIVHLSHSIKPKMSNKLELWRLPFLTSEFVNQNLLCLWLSPQAPQTLFIVSSMKTERKTEIEKFFFVFLANIYNIFLIFRFFFYQNLFYFKTRVFFTEDIYIFLNFLFIAEQRGEQKKNWGRNSYINFFLLNFSWYAVCYRLKCVRANDG